MKKAFLFVLGMLNLKLLRTMKKIIARMAMTAAVFTMCSYSFVSCSGGSGGMFGDVPGVAEKHAKEGIDLLTRLAESGTKEEIMDMLQNKSKQIDSIADAEIAAAIAALGDKEFPVEVDPGVPIKTLSDMKIVHDKCEKNEISIEVPVELTEETGVHKDFNTSTTGLLIADSEGNPLMALRQSYYKSTEEDVHKKYEKGAKGKVIGFMRFESWNYQLLAKAAKFRIANVLTDEYKQLRDSTRSMEKASNIRNYELAQKVVERLKAVASK